jgi:hypothetical protein
VRPQDQTWDELLGPPGDPDATVALARHQLGLGDVPPVRFQPPDVDVSGLADDLGLA